MSCLFRLYIFLFLSIVATFIYIVQAIPVEANIDTKGVVAKSLKKVGPSSKNVIKIALKLGVSNKKKKTHKKTPPTKTGKGISTYITFPIASGKSKTISKINHGDGTRYSPGIGVGSCGGTEAYPDARLVAALNHFQIGNGPNPNNNPLCGRYLNVTGRLGSVIVKIVDTCPVCFSGSVDLSEGAFPHIDYPEAGRVPITWSMLPKSYKPKDLALYEP